MDVYQALRTLFGNDPRVTVTSGKGAQGIKVPVKGKDKMLIMFSKGDLLLQLPPETVSQLIAQKKGLAYDPGTGNSMANRLLVPHSLKDSWATLVELTIESANH